MCKELCKYCGERILTFEESIALEEWIIADQSFDAGEFSGQHDYLAGICSCCPHGVDTQNDSCDDCDLEEWIDWEETEQAMWAATEGPQRGRAAANGEL